MLFSLKHLVALGLLAGAALAIPVPQEQAVVVPPLAADPAVPLAGDEKAKIEFGYLGNQGPKLWPDTCQDLAPGQSPVDIRPGSADMNPGKLAVTLAPLTGVVMENKGDGIKFTPPAGAAPITFVPVGQPNGAQDIFTLQEFHLHTPSEHTLNGKFFDAEMHMVFQSAAQQVAVIATFMQVSDTAQPNDFLTLVEQSLPLNKVPKDLAAFDLASVVAAANDFTGFFTYVGSLTTPPCSPNVLWHVMSKPIDISVGLSLALRTEQGMNARNSQVARDEAASFNGGIQNGSGLALPL